MTSETDDPAIIEVGLNEAALRSQNPHVPISPEECAADIRACGKAGAAVVHWHARDPESGEQRLGDVSLHSQVLESAVPDGPVTYPSYPVDVPTADRLTHCWDLVDRSGLEMVPVDLGSTNICIWDQDQDVFVGVDSAGLDGVVTNPTSFVQASLTRAAGLGVAVSMGSFDVGHTRSVGLLWRAGLLREPVYLKIFLSGAWPTGPEPTPQALDCHLAQLPDGLDVRWAAVPYLIDDPARIEELCRHALQRGGGIRVGIGDNPGAYPDRTNAEVVAQAVGWVADEGRSVCPADEFRRILSMRRADA